MLTITVLGTELFDEESQEFTTEGDVVLELEHSLAALSKWESIWEKPFISKEPSSSEEVLSYIECMILTPNFPRGILSKLSQKNLAEVHAYLDAKMTATWFADMPASPQSTQVITSELIYYWMFTMQIPIECENWHLSRLFTLIRIFDAKSAKPTKMSAAAIAARNRELNRQRLKQLGTEG